MTRRLLFGAALLAFAATSHACRCRQEPLEAYLGRAETVVLGTVRSVEDRAGPRANRTYVVDVEATYKGTNFGCRVVETGHSSCAAFLAEGERYLLFLGPVQGADEDDPVRFTSECRGNRPVTDEDLGELEALGPVPPGPVLPNPVCDGSGGDAPGRPGWIGR